MAMPGQSRRQAWNLPGQAHGLTFSCHRRFPFLASDRTCAWLAEAIDAARDKCGFALWAWVFMPEHVHLLVLPGADGACRMADILAAIKEPVGRRAMRFLKQHAPHWLPLVTRRRGSRVERLFWKSGGGYDRNVEDPRTLVRMIDYIHENPVRRGLVESATAWKWSSASWYIDGKPGPLSTDPIPWDVLN